MYTMLVCVCVVAAPVPTVKDRFYPSSLVGVYYSGNDWSFVLSSDGTYDCTYHGTRYWGTWKYNRAANRLCVSETCSGRANDYVDWCPTMTTAGGKPKLRDFIRYRKIVPKHY